MVWNIRLIHASETQVGFEDSVKILKLGFWSLYFGKKIRSPIFLKKLFLFDLYSVRVCAMDIRTVVRLLRTYILS